MHIVVFHRWMNVSLDPRNAEIDLFAYMRLICKVTTYLYCLGDDYDVWEPMLLSREFGRPQFMVFSWDDVALAACILNEVFVMNTQVW